MKKVILLILIGFFHVALTIAQKPGAVIGKAYVEPIIDGIVDDVWTTANEYNITVPFRTETPTLGKPGESTWKAIWNNDGIYLLIKVADDVWSPVYAGTSPNDSLFYDHPEIYFDSNYILNDGKGTNPDGNGGGNGHHLFLLSPAKGEVNGGSTSESNGGTYSYNVTETGYWVECYIPYSRLTDKDGFTLDKSGLIGFDITIVDNDTETPIRNRMSWANAGAIDENRNNMDDAGLIAFEPGPGPEPIYIDKITLFPDTISTDNGTLQMTPIIEPDFALNQILKWVVVNKTGKATIDSKGLVTAISNGIVEIQAFATDWGGAQASTEILITGQIIDQIDVWTNNNPLTVYPNPTSGKVKLIFNRIPNQKTNLLITDLSGKNIIKHQIRDKEVWIDLSGNPKGIYLFRTSDSSAMGKIILQ